MRHERGRRQTWMDFASNRSCASNPWVRGTEQDGDVAAQAPDLGGEKVYELPDLLDLLPGRSNSAWAEDDRFQL